MNHALRAALVALACLASSVATLTTPAPEPPVSVFLLRHAETEASTQTERDPALSDEGEARARALAKLLAKAGVTHLFSSERERTRATLAPLAEATGIEVQAVPAGDPGAQVEKLRALAPGSVAVVAGHSNTIPGLVAALGGTMDDLVDLPRYGEAIYHESYDRLVLVTLAVGGASAAKTIELRY